MSDIFDNKRLLLAVDAVTLFTVVFGGGVMWQKVENLQKQVQQLEVRSQTVTPAAGERLARVETKVEMLTNKLDSIDSKLDRLIQRR